MTASSKWLTALEWSQMTGLVGLTPAASPAEVIAALERRAGSKDAERTGREARAAAIRACRRCDPSGWRLGQDRLPLDPAVRCDHGIVAKPSVARDITEPLHEREETP